MHLFPRLFRPSVPRQAVSAPCFVLAAPAAGEVVPMEKIPDEVFASGMLGVCCGIEPEHGRISAPLDGRVVQISQGGYGVTILGDNQLQVMVHGGIDTVMLRGDGFCPRVRVGDTVKKGQLLLEMDLERIAGAGYAAMVITVVLNSDDFREIQLCGCGSIRQGEDLFRIVSREQ